MGQLGGIKVIVFDSIARAVDHHIAEGRYRLECFNLNLHWKGRGETVQIEFAGALTLRFEEELVLILLGEGDDFRFDAGTVTRANTLNLSVV